MPEFETAFSMDDPKSISKTKMPTAKQKYYPDKQS